MRTVLVLAAPLLTASAACGGRLAIPAEDDSPRDAAPDSPPDASDASLCAPAAISCDLPRFTPSSDACFTCTSAALCECRSVPNSTPWPLPADCDPGDAGCTNASALISQHACQVGAVEMVKCLTSTPHTACSELYADAHPGPGTIEPLGMEIALFRCTVCSACAEACAGSPNMDLCQ